MCDLQGLPLSEVSRRSGRSPGAVVILKGDKDADFGAVADLMDALATAKTLRFNLMTDLKKRTPREVAAGPAESSSQ